MRSELSFLKVAFLWYVSLNLAIRNLEPRQAFGFAAYGLYHRRNVALPDRFFWRLCSPPQYYLVGVPLCTLS